MKKLEVASFDKLICTLLEELEQFSKVLSSFWYLNLNMKIAVLSTVLLYLSF